jgi:hypothetical protein
MKIFRCLAPSLLLSVAFLVSAGALRAAETLDTNRLNQIAQWLPAQPAGFGAPITDRAAWAKLATLPLFADTVADAEKLCTKALPDQPDSLFLEFSQNGNRTRFQKVATNRRNRIVTLTLAEALENRGRFLPALEQTIAALCAEKTWVLPAHDRSLANFKGKEIVPDLGATGLATELAQMDFILGDKLSPATRKLIREQVRRRVLEPFRAMVEGRQREAFWLRAKMNWNAVCVGNIIFTALTLEPSVADRAFYATAGERLIRNSLLGFTPDGYCAEGIGYWNYGYGHDILATEALRRATGGKIDLLNDEAAIQPALFCLRSEVLPGIYPSIADCTPGSKPAADLTAYLTRRLGLSQETGPLPQEMKGLALSLMFASAADNLPLVRLLKTANDNPLRSFFPFGGVLISRTTEGNPAFAVALKGGHNDEPHNHNDVGSFGVYVGAAQIICDPGGEVYTARTFSSKRYDSTVLSSYGHAVPVIGEQLQRTGRAAQAVILETNFTAAADVFKLDIRSAYAVPALQKLERTFKFQRGANPSLEVRDEIQLSKPTAFETVLVTWGKVKKLEANRLQITDGDSSAIVTIATDGQPFELKQEVLDEDMLCKRQPTRLGFVFKNKITSGNFTFKIEPIKK